MVNAQGAWHNMTQGAWHNITGCMAQVDGVHDTRS